MDFELNRRFLHCTESHECIAIVMHLGCAVKRQSVFDATVAGSPQHASVCFDAVPNHPSLRTDDEKNAKYPLPSMASTSGNVIPGGGQGEETSAVDTSSDAATGK